MELKRQKLAVGLQLLEQDQSNPKDLIAMEGG